MKYVPLFTSGRREKRLVVYLDSVLITDGVEQSAVTRNISILGAMIECEHPPKLGCTVTLKYSSLELESSVVWTSEQRSGLRFLQPLEAGVLKVATGPALRVNAPSNKEQRFKPEIDCPE